MHQETLTSYFLEGVAAAGARSALPLLLPQDVPKGRTLVLGCGKAAAEMAAVAAGHLRGNVFGCVVTRHGHGVTEAVPGIDIIEASHPVPDDMSRMAGQKIRALAETATADDRVIFLISGGGSALLCDPIDGITLEQKAAITNHLVKSGTPIEDINLVRRHLSKVKGGRLAEAAAPAELYTYLISDVAGDDPGAIASGPSIATPFAPDRAVDVLRASGWPVDDMLVAAIKAQHPADVPDHPVHIIATAKDALDAIEARAAMDGWKVARLGDALTGDAQQIGAAHATIAAAQQPRTLLLSGGELTVTVRNPRGRGGPNLEYLAGLMAALPEGAALEALACDSDGIDGSENNAGGWFSATQRPPHDRVAQALASNRSYDLFAEMGGLIITGPTRTNVNDIRMIAVEG
jgi:glycerate 2-kinase